MFWNLAERAAAKLSRRCEDLEERLDKAERTLASLDLEFNELYDKTKSMLGRMAKRYAIMQESTQGAGDNGEARDSAPPVPAGLQMALHDIAVRRGLVK